MYYKTINAVIILSLLIGSADAEASGYFPYELSYPMDCSLSTGAGILMLGGAWSHYHPRKSGANDAMDLDRNDVNSFDRSAVDKSSKISLKASDYGVAALSVSPGLLILDPVVWSNIGTMALMYAQGYLISSGLFMTTKRSVGRKRPYMYGNRLTPEEKASRGDNSESFYSGHTALSFYSAVFLGKTFSDMYPDSSMRYAVWGALITAAGCVGYWRYAAGMHYPSDILAGAAAGSLAGYIIPLLHKKGTRDKITFSPVITPSWSGAAVTFHLSD